MERMEEEEEAKQLPAAPVEAVAAAPTTVPHDRVDASRLLSLLEGISDGEQVWHSEFGELDPSESEMTAQQLQKALELESIEVEWVVDVADNDNDFHIGTSLQPNVQLPSESFRPMKLSLKALRTSSKPPRERSWWLSPIDRTRTQSGLATSLSATSLLASSRSAMKTQSPRQVFLFPAVRRQCPKRETYRESI
eukprot:scaffold462_cov195-Pinguiococcus_pyrenoidosus.AAC.14